MYVSPYKVYLLYSHWSFTLTDGEDNLLAVAVHTMSWLLESQMLSLSLSLLPQEHFFYFISVLLYIAPLCCGTIIQTDKN